MSAQGEEGKALLGYEDCKDQEPDTSEVPGMLCLNLGSRGEGMARGREVP